MKRTSKWNLADIHIAILDGRTGAVKRCAAPEELTSCNAYAERRNARPQLRASAAADCQLLWARPAARFCRQARLRCHSRLTTGSKCCGTIAASGIATPEHAAYIPAVGDLDGDGRDEVNGGHFGPRPRRQRLMGNLFGRPRRQRIGGQVGNGTQRPLSRAAAQVLDGSGRRLLHLGRRTWCRTGRRCAAATCGPSYPGCELAIRYKRAPRGRDDRRARRRCAQPLPGR